MKDQLIQHTKNAFQEHFGGSPDYIFLSPGRINIIGEHVDYNDGFVLPAAIDKYICFAIREKKGSAICEMFAKDLDDFYSFDASKVILKGEKVWTNYLLGVIDEIQKKGKKIGGLEVVFSGNIPMGSGLSSSAALECGFGYALNTVFNLNLSKEEIVLIGQKSENTFVGVNCGVMDQFTSVFGKDEKVIFLNCNSLEYQYYDAKLQDYSFVLLDSCVKHTHLTSGYNDRRKEVEEGKEILWKYFKEMKTFRDCTLEMLETVKEEMSENIYKRCFYLIKEIKRVEEAVKALQKQDIKYLGNLLSETHHGLSQEYEISCPEIDFLVEETLKLHGVAGARMMGGGFGGCTINLIKTDQVESVINTIKPIYKQAFGIDMKVYQVKISDGIKEYKENEYSL